MQSRLHYILKVILVETDRSQKKKVYFAWLGLRLSNKSHKMLATSKAKTLLYVVGCQAVGKTAIVVQDSSLNTKL